MTSLRCSKCGSAYSKEYLQKNSPDNPCCRGNLHEFKGATPDEETQESYLQKLKEDPPKAPEGFRGVEDRDG